MKEIFDLILSASLSGSVIILLILGLRLVLKKAPKRYICLLWLLAGLRLLVPIQIESPLSLQPEVPPIINPQIQTPDPDPIPDQIPDVDPVIPNIPTPQPGDVPSSGGANTDIVVNPDAPGSDIVVNPGNSSSDVVVTLGNSGNITVTPAPDPVIDLEPTIDWTGTAAWVWLLGAGGMLLYTLVSYLVLSNRVREAVLVDTGIYESAAIDSPFLLGYVRPRIYLPVGLPLRDLDFILAHERTHIARGDNWAKLLGFLCLSVHWFNPLVWVAYGLLCKDIEMACDESVVRNMTAGDRKAYSTALVNCAATHRTLSACPLAFGEVSVKSRILNVLNYRKPSFWISLVCVVVIVFTLVCLMTDPVTVDPVQRCLDAMERLIAQENYVTFVDTVSYSGDGFPADRTRIHVQNGEDWYFRSAYTDYTVEYMSVDDKLYCNKALIAHPDEEIPFLQWGEVTDIDMDHLHEITGNWVLERDWAAQEYTLVESGDDRIVLTYSLEELEITFNFTTTFIFEAGTDNLIALEETIDEPHGSVSRIYHFLPAGESDTDNILRSYKAATGITPGTQLETVTLEPIQQELHRADYPSLLSAEVKNGILYIKACFANYNPEMEQAILQLQMQYGSAIQVEAINIDELRYPGQPPLFLQDRYIRQCINSMNAVHSQQKVYLQTWQQAVPNPGSTLRIKVGGNWMIQDVANDTASTWLNYNDQQFYCNQKVDQDGVRWVQQPFDRTFSLPWPLDGTLKSEDWEYVESLTEADNTLVVFLRQKSDGTLLRVSFANEQHLTGYVLTDPSGLVTDAVLSDPDGITPEEYLSASYQFASYQFVSIAGPPADSILDMEETDDAVYYLSEMEDTLRLYRLTVATGQMELLHTEEMPDVPRSWFQLMIYEDNPNLVRWETINPAFWQRYLAEQANPDSILFQPGIQNATPDYVEANPFREGVMYAFFAVQGEINLRPRMWCEYDQSTGSYTRLYGIYDKCFFATGVHADSEHFALYQEVTPE